MERKRKKALPERQNIEVVNAAPEAGLTEAQAEQRRLAGWENGRHGGASRSEGEIILSNCLTFFNFVFLALAVVLMLGGSSVKNLTFLVVVICNTVIGCYQEIKAKRTVDKLTLVAAQTVKTVREGKIVSIRSDLLVRDDIVEFSTGDQICADGVVRSGEIHVNESLVTGEADAIVKKPGDKLLSGSFVVGGTARAQLTGVGPDAFAAKLAAEAKADPHATKSEMMRSLDRLIQVVGVALVPVGIILFYQEYKVLKLSLTGSLEGTVAALVGMIPEGLYLLTSIAMAASSIKLAKQRVLVQDMNCIETLARVDVLCVDKTGTITEPRMEVENVIPLTEDPPEWLEAILGALYSGEEEENDTGRAMAELFGGHSDWVCTKHIPFTSSAKWGGAVFEEHGAFLAGAPEFVLGRRYGEVAETVEKWAVQGYRVLLVASYDGVPEPGALEDEKVKALALVLLVGRIREEAPATFAYFAQQGVSIRVISGDNPVTVAEVAHRAGIADAHLWVNTESLETDEDFDDAVQRYTVFGRVTPDKKKQLIRALKRAGHTVAMTGDGVNDVLAMKEADCGIAMASGAQAASQIAQLVLLDSDFAAMPSIVGEGRRVINNIQRAATLFLVKNIFSLALSIITLFTNWPYPIVPLHLSMISALTIGVPSFFLAMEPNYERVTGRFLPGVLRRAFPGGLTNIFVVLAAQGFMAAFDLPMQPISTVCAALLGVVGLLVLYQVCKPMDKFRRIIWWAMGAGLLGCFTLLGSLLELRTGSVQIRLVMATLLIMTPTVFFAFQRLFDMGDRVYLWIKGGRQGRLHLFKQD